MAKKNEDYGFMICEDGIYYGRALKNGTISADSHKVDTGEVIEMFSEILQDYCLRNKKPLVIERNGKPFIEATLIL